MGEPSPDLQFDSAEFEGNAAGPASCASCQSRLADTYYEVAGAVTCEVCKRRIESEWTQGSEIGARLGRLARATLFGGFAALAGCAVYYAVLALTGYEVGIISIAVGMMVGAAVRAGARGRGGWLYQGLAMFLTYTSIVCSYLPLVFKELASATDGVAPGDAAVAKAMMFILAIPFAYAVPFMQGAENILGILIIGFGVYQAWNMNKKQVLQVSGPYSLTARAVPSPSPAPAPIQP